MPRHTEQNLGEKRVLLGAFRKKTNLRNTYERLDIEERAFIASTNFNQRQLLSRQNKIRQLQTQPHGRLSLDKHPKTRTSFNDLPRNRESVILDYSNNLILPKSRHSLRSPREGKIISPFPGKDREGIREPDKHISSLHDSTDKRGKIKAALSVKSGRIEQGRKSVQQNSGVHVDDIVAYSASFGKKGKRWRGVTSLEHREVKNGGDDIASERIYKNDNPTVRSASIWKYPIHPASTDQHQSKTSNSPEEEAIVNSTMVFPHSDKNLFDPSSHSNKPKSRQRSSHVSPDKPTLKERATKLQPKSDNSLPKKPVQLKDSAGAILGVKSELLDDYDKFDTLTSGSRFVYPSVGGTVEKDSMSRSSQEEPFSTNSFIRHIDAEESERPNTVTPNLATRRPSWIASETLPALATMRRGSLCDVKTFTSGKVLDLLSSCKLPDQGKKENKQLLDVENLKYCRYLRSVTPEDAPAGGNLDIPLKYRPSKHIIIGHTKINPM